MMFPPPVLIPVLRVTFILWEMFIEVTFGFHESSHSHYMRCVSRTFGFHELSVIVDLYIQAYGLEALVAEKVFFLNFYIRKSQTSVISFSLQSNALLGDFDPYGDPYSDSYQREGRVGLEQVGSMDRFFQDFDPDNDVSAWAAKAAPSSPMASKILALAFDNPSPPVSHPHLL